MSESHMTAVNQLPESVADFMADIVRRCGRKHANWATDFQAGFANTLTTTVRRRGDETFLLTGDIPAMWLRDSAAQMRPYLVIARHDPDIATMIAGLVRRQIRDILIDPYANAFNEKGDGACWNHDLTEMGPWIWERKYEMDSLCYPVWLAWLLWRNTGMTTQFDEDFKKAARTIMTVWDHERDHAHNSPYRFTRVTERSLDTLSRNGLGPQCAVTGMAWSGFRPSDDACAYSYLIPSNMFCVTILGYLEQIFTQIVPCPQLAVQAQTLRAHISAGLRDHGLTVSHDGSQIWAYEVDGLGHASVMDDPNGPNLLGAPYFGFCTKDDPTYLATRRVVLSDENPFWYTGSVTSGMGSSHSADGWIWPLGLSMQGLTSTDSGEKERLLDKLVDLDAGTHLMHESVDANDPTHFTRPWFSWSNMLFCELVMDILGIRVRS